MSGEIRAVYVKLTADERLALVAQAKENRRHPSEEAAYIIAQALKKADPKPAVIQMPTWTINDTQRIKL